MTKTVGFKVDKIEWRRRVVEVTKRVKYFMNKIPSKEIFQTMLFYDQD